MKLRTPTLAFLSISLVACGQVEGAQADDYPGTDAQSRMVEDDDDDEGEDGEVALAADEFPDAIRAAALGEVPGLVITDGERETEDGQVVYCVHGTLDGEYYEVEVSAAGEILEVETGEDDD